MSSTEKLEQGIFIQNVSARRLFTLIKVVTYWHPFIHLSSSSSHSLPQLRGNTRQPLQNGGFQGIWVEIMRSLAPQKLKKTLTFLKFARSSHVQDWSKIWILMFQNICNSNQFSDRKPSKSPSVIFVNFRKGCKHRFNSRLTTNYLKNHSNHFKTRLLELPIISECVPFPLAFRISGILKYLKLQICRHNT